MGAIDFAIEKTCDKVPIFTYRVESTHLAGNFQKNSMRMDYEDDAMQVCLR